MFQATSLLIYKFVVIGTAQNTVISSNLMVWKFCEKA